MTADHRLKRWDLDKPGKAPEVLFDLTKEPFLIRETPDRRVIGGLMMSPDRSHAGLWVEDAFTEINSHKSFLLDTSRRDGSPRMGGDVEGEIVALSPEGKIAVLLRNFRGPQPLTLGIWDRNRPTAKINLIDNDPRTTAVDFSQDGQRLLIGRKDGAVLLWDDVSDQARPRELHRLGYEITAVKFSQDGQFFAAGDAVGHVYRGKLTEKGRYVGDFFRNKPVTSLAFSASGKLLAIATEEAIWIQDDNVPGTSLTKLPDFRGHDGRVYDLAFTSDTLALISCSKDGTVRRWDLKAGLAQPSKKSTLTSAAGIFRAMVEEDGTAQVWSGEGKPIGGGPFRGQSGRLHRAVVSSDGRWLVGAGSSLEIWDITNRLPRSFRPPPGTEGRRIVSITAGRAARRFYTADDHGAICEWIVEDHTIRSEIVFTAEGAVPPIAVSDDRRLVMAATKDNTVLLWDLSPPSGETRLPEFPPRPNPCVLRGSGYPISAMAIATDQRLVAIADAGGNLFIWQNRPEPVIPEGPGVVVPIRLKLPDFIRVITLSPNNRRVFATSYGSGPRYYEWTLDPRELIDLARQTGGRNLTFAEWKEFFSGEPYRPTFPELPVPPFDPRHADIARNLSESEWRRYFPDVPHRVLFKDLPVPQDFKP